MTEKRRDTQKMSKAAIAAALARGEEGDRQTVPSPPPAMRDRKREGGRSRAA